MRLSRAIAFSLVAACGWLLGCATSQISHEAAALFLRYEQFDQTFGSGWRPLFDQHEYAKAASLIERYLQTHDELTVGQTKFLHLHAGMILALEGSTGRAVKHLDRALTASPLAEVWPDWNDYIAATRAFLVHDRSGLESARDRCAASHSPRLAQVERLVQLFGSTYADWYWWARICPRVVIPGNAMPEHRAAAEKLAKAFNASFSISDNGPQPSCVWVEVRDFAPKSSAMGYVIIHSPDGTQISASNGYWLNAAVERFMQSSRVSHGFREAPFGLTTSFNLALTPYNPLAPAAKRHGFSLVRPGEIHGALGLCRLGSRATPADIVCWTDQ